MSSSTIAGAVKRIMYGSAIGENPPKRRTISNTPTITGGYITGLNLSSGEGDKVAPGHILTSLGTSSAGDMRIVEIASVSSDVVEGFVGLLGASEGVAGDYTSASWEQNANPNEAQIHDAIDTVIEQHLFPEVFDITTTTLTPDIANMTHDMPADTRDVVRVTQLVGQEPVRIAFSLHRNEHTSISANGALLQFDPINGNTVYVTYTRKFTDSVVAASTSLTQIVATGAAAILAGQTVNETTMERSSKDSQARGESRDVGSILWRDFLTLKNGWAMQLTEDFDHFEVFR